MSNSYISVDIRWSENDLSVFAILIFISVNLLFISVYSKYREWHALDPDYLQRIRSISLLNTLLQIACFSGYWLNLYALYECAWICWLTLSTYTILRVSIKMGQSYIILVSTNYKLHEHQSIPRNYRVFVFSFWCIGSLIDTTGTVFGFLKMSYIQSICYAVWEVMCCISIIFVLHMLRSIKYQFSHLMQQMLDSKQDSKQTPFAKQTPFEPFRSSLSKIHAKPLRSQLSSDALNCKQPQSTTKSHTFRSPLYREDTTTYTVTGPELSGHILSTDRMNAQHVTSSAVSTISTMHTVNGKAFSALKGTEDTIKYEMRRMRNLQIGLYLLIVVFLMNAVFNGLLRFYQPGAFWFFEDTRNDRNIYVNTPTEIVAVVFFPQWTIINIFIVMFSWIPDSRLADSWDD